jgi:two-component system sensor histidine kinase/response regulator
LAERIGDSPHLAGAVLMMLTSGEQPGDAQRCHKLGISAHLTKPVRRAELRSAIATSLARPSLPGLEEGRPAPAPSAPAPSAPAPHAGSKAHILLAEDNFVNQQVALGILLKQGYRVVVAVNGLEALKAFGEQTFDLVLMDVQMPEMGGFAATAEIRERERGRGTHVPIIAMTAHAMSGDRERCLAAGMDDYISKPIRGRALTELIDRYCRQPAI